MRRRYFRFMFEDSLGGLLSHESGYLVNRKPLVFSFLKNRPKVETGRKSASVRMGNQFVKRLKEMGL